MVSLALHIEEVLFLVQPPLITKNATNSIRRAIATPQTRFNLTKTLAQLAKSYNHKVCKQNASTESIALLPFFLYRVIFTHNAISEVWNQGNKNRWNQNRLRFIVYRRSHLSSTHCNRFRVHPAAPGLYSGKKSRSLGSREGSSAGPCRDLPPLRRLTVLPEASVGPISEVRATLWKVWIRVRSILICSSLSSITASKLSVFKRANMV